MNILEGILHPHDNPGAGFNNIHSETAWQTQVYFANTYPQTAMANLLKQNRGDLPAILLSLATSDGNIRYASAYLRQLADYRKNSPSTHLTDLSVTDQAIIYGAYRAGIGPEHGYIDLRAFQNATTPGQRWGPIFLQFYYSQ